MSPPGGRGDIGSAHTEIAPSHATSGEIVTQPAAARAKRRAARGHDALCGKLVDGRYRIIERIGEGGVGVVYAAEHVQLRRKVAVKVLHPLFVPHSEFRLRFEREAMAASQASHPACVAVLDFGTFDGRPYLVMEYVEGKLLSDRLRQGRLPLVQAVVIARQILGALRHAHGLGIIHRDIKPGNIMLCQPAQTGAYVKLLDFGLAKHLGSGAAAQSALTQVGAVFGTPGYISPEQAAGVPVDARSDLYSMGVVLFEMVCGQRPFVHDEQLEVLRAHLDTTAPRASSLRPDISPALEDVVAKSLAKERQERFQSADEFIVSLGEVPESAGVTLSALPDDARAASPAHTSPRPAPATIAVPWHAWHRRHPRLFLAAAVAAPAVTLATLALILVAALGSGDHPSPFATDAGIVGGSSDTSAQRRQAPAKRGAARRTDGPSAAPGPSRDRLPSAPVAATGTARSPDTPPPPKAPRTATPLSPAVRRAEAALRAGHPRSAIRHARRALARNRNDARARLVLGHAYARRLWHSDALVEYGRALGLDPSLRDDPAMTRHVINALGRRRTARRAGAFIVTHLGVHALPALADASRNHRDADVRRRTAVLEKSLRRRQGR